MSKKIIILVSFLIIVGALFILLLSNTCNSHSGLFPIKEQRCRCLGLVWDFTPRGSALDGEDSDQCLGIITKKSYIDKRLPNEKVDF